MTSAQGANSSVGELNKRASKPEPPPLCPAAEEGPPVVFLLLGRHGQDSEVSWWSPERGIRDSIPKRRFQYKVPPDKLFPSLKTTMEEETPTSSLSVSNSNVLPSGAKQKKSNVFSSRPSKTLCLRFSELNMPTSSNCSLLRPNADVISGLPMQIPYLLPCGGRCPGAQASILWISILQASPQLENEPASSTQNDDILTWCSNNRRCSQCLKPCRALWDAPKNHCWEICATQHECLTSCEFLKTLQTVKQGDCPPAARASGFAAACVQSCEGDRECPGNRKCCFNACGHTCQIPDNINRGVPLRPRKSLTILERSGGTVQVSWKSKSSISIEPVFYVLQSRWHWGLHPSEDDATEWKAMALTMEESAHLDSIGPNRWYQFRVAAVNAHGTRGFTPPSKHFQSSRAPLPPGSPQNLRKGNITASPDGAHSIIISWDPPSEGALAVHHYRVSWGCWAPEADGPSPKMRSLRVTRAKPEVRLDGLEAGTAYQVQVRTVAFWSQKRLKSPKSQMLIVMPAGELLNELPAAQRVPALRVQVESPYYLQNDLQVNVQWRGASSRRPGIYLLTWRPISCATNHTASATQALVQPPETAPINSSSSSGSSGRSNGSSNDSSNGSARIIQARRQKQLTGTTQGVNSRKLDWQQEVTAATPGTKRIGGGEMGQKAIAEEM
ncbi:anosmin-1-like [Monodelphis domestica]|uniref:anosmin-1-like n=1 Tax=Monodelphis domestica TaxID=13616 RepID=UPI0024E21789|nr:anosmin-1-like [Monodelphis domestica]